MMKAVQLHEYGGPEVLQYEDAPRPELKAGEVLVRVHAAGINPPDLYLRDGCKMLPPEWRPVSYTHLETQIRFARLNRRLVRFAQPGTRSVEDT